MGNGLCPHGPRLRATPRQRACVRQCRGALALCLDDGQRARLERPRPSGWERIEELFKELFRLQDLNQNGLLEEAELIKVNEKIALLHHGHDADLAEVREIYHRQFRERFDAQGQPVAYDMYRQRMGAELDELTKLRRDWREQEMILEQWVAEVESARAAFFLPDLRSPSDAEFVSKLSAMRPGEFSPRLQAYPWPPVLLVCPPCLGTLLMAES